MQVLLSEFTTRRNHVYARDVPKFLLESLHVSYRGTGKRRRSLAAKSAARTWPTPARTLRSLTLDPLPLGCTRARCVRGVGAGGRRVGSDEKESRRKARRRDVRRVYKEREGRDEGRGNGGQRGGIGEGEV